MLPKLVNSQVVPGTEGLVTMGAWMGDALDVGLCMATGLTPTDEQVETHSQTPGFNYETVKHYVRR